MSTFRAILIIDALFNQKVIAEIPPFDNAPVIAANSALESPQFGGGHGELTWNVFRGLGGEADANADRRVTASEFAVFIAKQKPSDGGHPPLIQNSLPGDLPLVELPASNSKAY